jgi:CRP-like cAMP-binding protein
MVTRQQKMDRLQGLKLFQSISEEDLGLLADSLEEQTYSQGEMIIRQNGTEQVAYIIHSGRVSIHIDALLMSNYVEGQMFGEFSMLDGTKYSATAVAQTDCVLLALSRDVFYERMAASDDFRKNIIKSLVKRLKRQLA